MPSPPFYDTLEFVSFGPRNGGYYVTWKSVTDGQTYTSTANFVLRALEAKAVVNGSSVQGNFRVTGGNTRCGSRAYLQFLQAQAP